jgi:hypothetical protein
MTTCHDDLHDARIHLRQAARAMGDRILGRDVANHLRQAAKHALKAGVAALEECEQEAAKPAPNTPV